MTPLAALAACFVAVACSACGGNAPEVVGAVRFAEREGAGAVVLAGASIGAMSSLRAAARDDVDIAALVEIAGVNHVSGYDFHEREIAAIGGAKLFVSAEKDAYGGDDAARDWYAWATPPKTLKIVPGLAHGTDLLRPHEATAAELESAVVEFLERHAPG